MSTQYCLADGTWQAIPTRIELLVVSARDFVNSIVFGGSVVAKQTIKSNRCKCYK
jgi:hypothetical protein